MADNADEQVPISFKSTSTVTLPKPLPVSMVIAGGTWTLCTLLFLIALALFSIADNLGDIKQILRDRQPVAEAGR